jgi:hypothetical protein
MFSRIFATVAFAASTALPAWCQDAAKPAAAPAADTDAQAHEFLKTKVDKTMYSLSAAGLKSAVLQTDMNLPMLGDAAIKSKYVWQADPPKEKFSLLDTDKMPQQLSMMKGMLEESLKDSARNLILESSLKWKDLKLSMGKTDDGNVSITLPERTTSMGPMTMKRQETHIYTPDGKLVRSETKMSSQMMGDVVQKGTVTLKDIGGGKWLVIGREDSSPQGSAKTEITYEEKDGFQVPVQSKQSNQMGEQAVKFTFTVNPKLTDADFADAPAKKEG